MRKVLPVMTLASATRIKYEAHSSGRAVTERCHRELAELYEERLQDEGLSMSREPAE